MEQIKAFGEHIRKVHLTLMVLCLGLLVGTTFELQSDMQRAERDLKKILELKDNWNQPWLTEYLLDQISTQYQKLGDPIEQPRRTYTYSVKSNSVPQEMVFLEFTLPTAVVQFGETLDHRQDLQYRGGVLDIGWRIQPLRTLKDVQILWDKLAKSQFLYIPTKVDVEAGPSTSNATFVSVDHEFHRQEDEKHSSFKGAFVEISHHCPDTDPKWSRDRMTYSTVLCSTDEHVNFKAKITWARTSIDLRRAILSYLNVEWQRREYDKAFPDLSNVTKGYATYGLEEAHTVLLNELRRKEETIEIFGARFPREQLSLWGGALILLTQLYFLMHLVSMIHVLEKSLSRGGEVSSNLVPWIGFYDTPLARGITWLSTIVVPAVIVVFLSNPWATGTNSPAKWSGFFIYVGLACLLSFFIHRWIAGLRKIGLAGP